MKKYIGYLEDLDAMSEEDTISYFKVNRPNKVIFELPESVISKIEKCFCFMSDNNVHNISFLSSIKKDKEHGVFKYYKDEVELVSPDYEDFGRKWKVFKNDNAKICLDSFSKKEIKIEMLYVNAYTETVFTFYSKFYN